MGSKNTIADFIGANLPRTENFYDVFCGGCAVTHWALVHNIAKNYYASDINFASELFIKAIRGEYRNETRWISREDFERLKNSDPYVRLCWSFGNNQNNYLYSVEIDEWKRALWFARVFGDTSLFAKFGIITDGSRKHICDNLEAFKKKYIEWYLREVYIKLQGFLYFPQDYEEIYGLQDLLQSLERLERLQSLDFKLCSYDEVDIKPNSVIYCDPPYKNTATYRLEDKELVFDHDRFYNWCLKQKELVIISEYDMPSDFECVAGREKYQQLAGIGRGQLKIECLFVPKHQVGLYRQRVGRLF